MQSIDIVLFQMNVAFETSSLIYKIFYLVQEQQQRRVLQKKEQKPLHQSWASIQKQKGSNSF